MDRRNEGPCLGDSIGDGTATPPEASISEGPGWRGRRIIEAHLVPGAAPASAGSPDLRSGAGGLAQTWPASRLQMGRVR